MAGVKRSAPDDEAGASASQKSSPKRGDEESESDGSTAFTGKEAQHNLEKGDAAAGVGADDTDGGHAKMQGDDEDVKEEEGGSGGAGSQASKRQKVEVGNV